MKHILTILVAMLALGSYASEPFSADSVFSEKASSTIVQADSIHEVKKSWMTRFLD